MKKPLYTTIIFLLTIFSSIHAQLFSDEGNLWHQDIPLLAPGSVVGYSFVDGDTIIEAKLYAKVYQVNEIFDIDTTYLCAVRANIDSAWMFLPAETSEVLLYNWALAVGDTAHSNISNDYIIEAIDSIMLFDGQVRKRLEIFRHHANGTSFFGYSIAGIGLSDGSLFNPFWQFSLPNLSFMDDALRCFSRNGETLWMNSLYSNCDSTITNTQTLFSENKIISYPNPVRDELSIEFKDATFQIKTVSVYDAIGLLIYRKENFEDISMFQLSTLNWYSGVYFIQIKGVGNESHFLKIIKQ